jgi:hypothetical protein
MDVMMADKYHAYSICSLSHGRPEFPAFGLVTLDIGEEKSARNLLTYVSSITKSRSLASNHFFSDSLHL